MDNRSCAAHLQVHMSLSSLGDKNLITELRFRNKKNPTARMKNASRPRNK